MWGEAGVSVCEKGVDVALSITLPPSRTNDDAPLPFSNTHPRNT